jgi:hypothetical protein
MNRFYGAVAILMLMASFCLAQETQRPTEGGVPLPGNGLTVSSTLLYDFMNAAGIENLKTSIFAGVDGVLFSKGSHLVRLRTGPSFYSASVCETIGESLKSLLNPGYVNLMIQPSYTYKIVPEQFEVSVFTGIGAKGNVYAYNDPATGTPTKGPMFSASAKAGLAIVAFKYGGLAVGYKIANDCFYPSLDVYNAVFPTRDPWNGAVIVNLSAFMPQSNSYLFAEYRAFVHGAIFGLYGAFPLFTMGIRQDLDITGIMTSFR